MARRPDPQQMNLLALLDAAGPHVPLAAEPDIDPVDGSRPVPMAPANFMETLARVRAEAAVARAAEFCVGRALVEAGLAEWAERGVKLLPPAASVLRLHWQQPMHQSHKHKLYLLDDAYSDSPVVRRVEEVTRLQALPAERHRQPATNCPRGRSVTTS